MRMTNWKGLWISEAGLHLQITMWDASALSAFLRSKCEAELSSAEKAHFSSFPIPVSSPSVSHLMENEVNLMVWFSHSKSNPTLPGFTVHRAE